MQPNGNMPGAAQPASPVRPVAPVGPTKPVNPAAPVKPAAPAGGPTFDNGPAVVEGKGGKKTGWMLGIVLCLILAAGGVGFGVWTWMDSNTQKDALNSQITSLKQQNNSLQEQLDNGGVEHNNPIIQSLNSDEEYRVWLSSSIVDGKEMRIGIKDGIIDICSIYETNGAFVGDCTIDGVSGEIFNVVEFGQGQDNSDSNIGFIMTDGSVYYFPFVEAMKNNDFGIKGKLNVDGFVTDAIEITAGPTDPGVAGGYGSTIFILKDGTYVKFDETMLN